MYKGLRVQDRGVFILDNPQLTLQQGLVIPFTVEAGGRLELRQPFTLEKWVAENPTIVIKKGGVLLGAQNLPDGALVLDENKPQVPPETLPPETLPSEPPVEDGRDEIANIFEEDFRFSFAVGDKPDLSIFPAEAHVAVLGYDEAPLEWDLTYVDFDSAGTYSATGYFTQQGLDEHKLSNPENYTMHMMIQIYEKNPPENLRGFLLSTSPGGYTLIKLVLPALPMEQVTAVYIYRSADAVNWQQESWKGQPGTGIFQTETNFYSLVRTEGRSSMIPFRYQSNSEPVWLRVEVIGSDMAGMSNSIYLETAVLPPEEVDNGDGDGMGNRGGGGQDEGNRELLNVENKAFEGSIPPEDEIITSGDTFSSTPHRNTPQIEAQPYKGRVVGGSYGSKPMVATPSDAGQEEEVTESFLLPEQETEPVMLEVQAPSDETQISPPPPKSRGVLLTAEATAFAAVGLLLLRKLYKIRKKKS